MMSRVPVVPALSISVAFAIGFFWVAHVITGKDLLGPMYVGLWMFLVAGGYDVLRGKAASLMERCTTSGVMGSMLIVWILDRPDLGWPIAACGIGAGIVVIFSPHLLKARWERS